MVLNKLILSCKTERIKGYFQILDEEVREMLRMMSKPFKKIKKITLLVDKRQYQKSKNVAFKQMMSVKNCFMRETSFLV